MDDFIRSQQLLAAEDLSSRLKRGKQRLPAAVRTSFVGDPRLTSFTSPPHDASTDRAPLSIILGNGGGRGGSTRLKLYLSLLWTAKQEPFTVRDASPAFWAYLIGLDGKEPSVRRSITRNFRWLAEHGFLRPFDDETDTGGFLILEESGNGSDYSPPYEALKKSPDDETRNRHYYFKIPHLFWTDGLIAELNQAEIACLLILLDQLRRRNGPPDFEPIWWAETHWQRRYGLSADTRQKGFGGLMNRGIVRREPGHLVPAYDAPRGRHPVYILADTRLDGRSIKDTPPGD